VAGADPPASADADSSWRSPKTLLFRIREHARREELLLHPWMKATRSDAERATVRGAHLGANCSKLSRVYERCLR